jgi:hypothetical protein
MPLPVYILPGMRDITCESKWKIIRVDFSSMTIGLRIALGSPKAPALG